jgi:putative hemolysin
MLRTARTQGVLEQEEGLVHENLFVFNDLKAQSLMTHYSEIDWIDTEMTKGEIIDVLNKSKHSKFPVASQQIDNIKGYVTSGDLWELLRKDTFSLESITHPPVYLAESSDAFDVIDIFRKQKTHIGFVLDEYGAIRGIITLYDLMSALFGEMPDEQDDAEEAQIVEKNDGTYIIDAQIPIFEFNKYFHQELLRFNPHYTTLAGFLLYKLQDLPKEGQVVDEGSMTFEVIDMDKVRIDKISLKFNKDQLSVR